MKQNERMQTAPPAPQLVVGNLENEMRHLAELETEASIANENIRLLLRGLPKEDMKLVIGEMQLSDDGLDFLGHRIALEKEDYEICTVVEEIKKERLLDPFRDSGDHLNYTNI